MYINKHSVTGIFMGQVGEICFQVFLAHPLWAQLFAHCSSGWSVWIQSSSEAQMDPLTSRETRPTPACLWLIHLLPSQLLLHIGSWQAQSGGYLNEAQSLSCPHDAFKFRTFRKGSMLRCLISKRRRLHLNTFPGRVNNSDSESDSTLESPRL